MNNLILIGMSGCGKSTVGRRAAELAGAAFADTDEIIVNIAGKSISEIFACDGERHFRALEEQACAEAAKLEGAVIATGGGAVLNPSNLAVLAKSGRIVFIRRPVEDILATADRASRPLFTDEAAVRRLYERRLPIYTECADIVLDNEDAEECARRLAGLWEQ